MEAQSTTNAPSDTSTSDSPAPKTSKSKKSSSLKLYRARTYIGQYRGVVVVIASDKSDAIEQANAIAGEAAGARQDVTSANVELIGDVEAGAWLVWDGMV